MGYRRIYYDVINGEKIVEVALRGGFTPKTIEQDIASFTALSERNRETFDYIELEYGQYAQDFRECNGYRVNPETKSLEFSYPDPNAPEEPQPYQAPLSEKVELLDREKTILQLVLAETIEKQETEKIYNQLALAELIETLTLKGVL